MPDHRPDTERWRDALDKVEPLGPGLDVHIPQLRAVARRREVWRTWTRAMGVVIAALVLLAALGHSC